MSGVRTSQDIANDFPILNQLDRPLVYLDSAATSQKPRTVIDAVSDFYETINANVARGVYDIAERSTNAMEASRKQLASFIGAPNPREVIFTKNATESLNLVAQGWGRHNLGPTDAVVLSELEHHANIVPWQILQAEIGFEIRWIEVDPDGYLKLDDLDTLIPGAKMVSVTAMSNVTGTLVDTERIISVAHKHGALVSLDACQLVPHVPLNIAELDCDFLSFSGHKMLGPNGVGVMWGRLELLEHMAPFLGGGGMIQTVSKETYSAAPVPHKFEAGTPAVAEIVGLAAAATYLDDIGMTNVRQHEIELTRYFFEAANAAFGNRLTIHGPKTAEDRGGVFSLDLGGVHPHDISQVLDSHHVCVRAGHHCAKPLMGVLGVGATARASVYIYNHESDIDALIAALLEAEKFFAL